MTSIVNSLHSIDISCKEHVHVLHAIEGGERLRAHKGTLYIYDSGSYVPFEGVLPVAMLSRVKHCLLGVEGALRLMAPGIPRKQSASMEALRRTHDGHASVDAWLGRRRLPSTVPCFEEASRGGMPSARTRAGRKTLWCRSRNVEWCETEMQRAKGFATPDASCVVDSEGQNLRHIQKSPGANFYVFIPHSITQAVDVGVAERVHMSC